MSWLTTAVIAGSVGSSYLASSAQKKAATTEAELIIDARERNDERYEQIRQDAMSLFDDAMASTFSGMQEGRNLLLSGQASTQDILNQAYSGAANTIQTYGQQSINAMLGITGQQPTIQNIQAAEQQLPPEQQTQPLTQVGPPPGGQPLTQVGPAPGAAAPTGAQTALYTQPDGTVRSGQQQGFDYPAQTGVTGPQRDFTGGEQLFGDVNPIYNLPESVTQYNVDPLPETGLLSQPQALEGEFIPSGYNLPQTALNLPQGQYGLAGAEQALTSGAEQARQDLAFGTSRGISALGRELGFAGDEIRRGRDFGLGEIRGAVQTGRGDITGAAQQGAQTALAGAQRGVSFLDPYMSAGREALDPYLALSGARGQEAFDQAILNDPAYQLALERSEQSIGRQSALTGGIGGGNVMAELQRNAQMQAAADIDRQLGRYQGITQAGQAAAGTAGGFTTQAGLAAGGMQTQAGRDLSALGMQGGTALAGIGQQSSAQIAELARTMGISELQAMQMLGQNLGNVGMQAQQQIGDYRFGTGTNIANTLGQQGITQGGLQTGLGGALAGLDQQTIANLVNQAEQLGGGQAGLQTALANLLANAGVNQASQQTGLGTQLAGATASGVTNPLGNALSTITGLAASNPSAFGFGSNVSPGQTPPIVPETMNLNYSTITPLSGIQPINDPAYLAA